MSETSFKKAVWSILIVAAVLRLGFLCFGEVLPVMWDARRYAAAAIGVIARVDSSELPDGDTAREDGEAFQRYYRKYIQGEEIDWMHYRPHKLSQARDELYTSGPVYPTIMAVLFAVVPTGDFTAARLFTIAGDVAATLLLILVAVRLVGKRAALIAGLLYAICFPIVLISTMLLLESSTTLMILAAIYLLLRGMESDLRWPFVAAGILIGLLVLHKPTAMLLGGPLLVGWWFYAGRGRISWRAMGMVALPALLIALTWTAAASARYGQLTLRDPSYAGINLRQSCSIENEGYGVDNVGSDFDRRPIYGRLFERFPEYVGLFSKKFERLYSRPYNDFRRTFLWPRWLDERLHVIVLSLGMIGLLLLTVRNPRRAAWPLLIVGYYSLIHIIFHSTCRYSLNAMPMLFIGAGYAVRLSIDASRRKRNLHRIALASALLICGWLLNPEFIRTVIGVPSYGSTLAIVLARIGLLIAGLILLANSLLPRQPVWNKSSLVILAAGAFAIMTWSTIIARDAWTEFSLPLDDPAKRAGTRVYISELAEVAEGEFLAAMVDVRALRTGGARLKITVPGSEQTYTLGAEPLAQYFYPYPAYDAYARLMSRGIEEFPHYAVVGLDADMIAEMVERQGYVDLCVTSVLNPGQTGATVEIFGTYATGADSTYVPSSRQVSIERWVHRGDPRLRLPVKFLSDSAVSYYIGSRDPVVVSAAGTIGARHDGRFNMFLVHYRKDFRMLVY
jgi:4-amino-4-deoxy-L-arabinose transferase-like glycosyltransferase